MELVRGMSYCFDLLLLRTRVTLSSMVAFACSAVGHTNIVQQNNTGMHVCVLLLWLEGRRKAGELGLC